ncbi:LysM domain [Actinomyces slackii]|uniref:LysM domain n=1 Tax=Actinomyces slackii TaxID=52774 RepID=A0A448KDC5_9ACTO|nr:LysM domain [Actinomyces slackii]
MGASARRPATRGSSAPRTARTANGSVTARRDRPQAAGVAVQVRRAVTVISACLAVIALVATAAVAAVALPGVGSAEATGTAVAVVQPGQSLWEIASSTGTSDVPGTVATIVELNSLEDSTIHAGQRLTVPVH